MTTGAMSPEEFRAIRERWGVSQTVYGKALGVGGTSPTGPKNSVSRYERGDVPIGPTLAKLVLCMDRMGDGRGE